jgi:tetratricopeptide (TPR) repeat protein
VAQPLETEWATCKGADSKLSAEARIAACAKLIESGQLDSAKLASAHFYRGIAFSNLGDRSRAINDFSEAIRLQPDNPAALNDRGNQYSLSGDFKRAIADYDEAIRLDPGIALTFENRGMAYEYLRDARRAIESFNEAIRLKPDYADALFNRGMCYYILGDLDHAVPDFREAVRLDPSSREHVPADVLAKFGT